MDSSDLHHTGSTLSANEPAVQPSPARCEGPLHKHPAHDSGTKGAVHGLHSRHTTGRSHDMLDPAMAASMEADIRARFWVALALSALVVVISPMGEITTTSADRASATQKRARMSASIDAAIAGSNISCDLPVVCLEWRPCTAPLVPESCAGCLCRGPSHRAGDG